MTAIWEVGGVYVPVNPRLPQAEVDTSSPTPPPRCWFTEAGIAPVDGAPRTYPDDVAFVVWTSGTTGRPKPILHTHTAYLELLDRVLGPLRRAAAAAAGAEPEPHPGVDGAQRRHLQLAVRTAGRRAPRDHGPLRARRPSPSWCGASRSGRPCCRPRRWRCSPTPPSTDLRPLQVRPVDHRASVAAPGPALRGQVRRRARPQRLRPGRDGRGHRLDRGRCQGPPGEGRRRRTAAPRRRDPGLRRRPPAGASAQRRRRDRRSPRRRRVHRHR